VALPKKRGGREPLYPSLLTGLEEKRKKEIREFAPREACFKWQKWGFFAGVGGQGWFCHARKEKEEGDGSSTVKKRKVQRNYEGHR